MNVITNIVFGVTPIILFEYFNDINRTKRRCQQKDLQSLHPFNEYEISKSFSSQNFDV